MLTLNILVHCNTSWIYYSTLVDEVRSTIFFVFPCYMDYYEYT